MKRTVTEKYDEEGNLIERTTVEENIPATAPVVYNPWPYVWYYYPAGWQYPVGWQQPVQSTPTVWYGTTTSALGGGGGAQGGTVTWTNNQGWNDGGTSGVLC